MPSAIDRGHIMKAAAVPVGCGFALPSTASPLDANITSSP